VPEKALHPIVALLIGNREKNDSRMEKKYGKKEVDKGTKGIK
jgi:hypothetical protein